MAIVASLAVLTRRARHLASRLPALPPAFRSEAARRAAAAGVVVYWAAAGPWTVRVATGAVDYLRGLADRFLASLGRMGKSIGRTIMAQRAMDDEFEEVELLVDVGFDEVADPPLDDDLGFGVMVERLLDIALDEMPVDLEEVELLVDDGFDE